MSDHRHMIRRRSYTALTATRGRLCAVSLLALGLLICTLPLGERMIHAAMAGSQPATDAAIQQVSIDSAGVIAYIKGDGIYTFGRGGGLRRVVAAGDEAPRAGGRFIQFLDLSSASISGPLGVQKDLRIVFKARIEGGIVDEGIFLFSENLGLAAVALPGDTAPDTGGGTFASFPDRPLIGSQGTIMFKAMVMGGRATEGLFFVPRQFFTGEATIGSVAIVGEPAPGTGGGAYAGFGAYDMEESTVLMGAPPLVVASAFAFVADVDGGRTPQGIFARSLFLVPEIPVRIEIQRPPTEMALAGNPPPSRALADSVYARFEDVVLTQHELVFRAILSGGEVSEGIFQLAFLGPITLPSPRVLQGDLAPIVGADVRFAQFGRMVGNNAEELVFEATLEGDGPSQGLFSATLGPLNLVSETLSVGDRAQGTDGGVFHVLGPLAINDDGFVAFQAKIDGGSICEGLYRELAKRARLIDGVPCTPAASR